ncbi:thiamine pyrophosphate-binding protein [Paracoccus sp. 1_MG-2023]|uniref:thiamine pyrophosphate-binding protein n=1 Tax=unclassified Paracoccus (in: a-proteobacteria) TaxID=2688777 RepID=UPI001C0A19F8|nr:MULTISPECIES: thiamine pyrophosphate-binding protein [unclassified Paracoccus (in: a-proteobacteria)]MBU2957663.1 thiamine pyrophosphate-binding protein [Paracoccus sp. C2R09]MDO6667489.1 thiamine pyrophosphate-binding protein [Paracoccus sp. 1_MG-2023]
MGHDDNGMAAADILAGRLYRAGCRIAFGMPGGEVLVLIDALARVGIEFVLAKHENAAGFMAEGVYHRTGAPALLVTTVGPGALNAVNVVENARQDRVPMIVLTGAIDTAEAATYTHQVLEQREVFRPVTKASFTFDAGAAAAIADKAVAIACEGRPGPVHIDVPISVASAPVQARPSHDRIPAAPTVPAEGADLAQARRWLADAERPIVIMGLDAMNQNAGAAIRDFAQTFGAPVISTYKAKGLIPEDHPLSLGAAGLSPKADRLLLPLLAEADLIICVGYDPIEMRVGWRDPWDPSQVPVIDITAAPNHHYMHQARVNFVADCGATLAALALGVTPRATWPGDRIARLQDDMATAFPRDEEWGPAAIVDTCMTSLPDGTLATVDSGAHRILLSQMWRCTEPRGLMQSSGLCTMGCAVPLAIGAALATPERHVVSFSGDAGFLMVAGELATAAELRTPVIFVVFVDASLALIDLKQRQMGLTSNGVDFDGPDIAAIGRAFGGAGHTVRCRAELRDALKTAMAETRFTVIAAVIDRKSYDGRL